MKHKLISRHFLPLTGDNALIILLLTIEGSALEGTFEGKLVDTIYGSGQFLAAQGTGDFEGWRVMGSWSVVFTSETHASIDCVGMTMRP